MPFFIDVFHGFYRTPIVPTFIDIVPFLINFVPTNNLFLIFILFHVNIDHCPSECVKKNEPIMWPCRWWGSHSSSSFATLLPISSSSVSRESSWWLGWFSYHHQNYSDIIMFSYIENWNQKVHEIIIYFEFMIESFQFCSSSRLNA